jgi:hypothetical protein
LIERTSLGFTFFLLIENLVFCIDETKKAIQKKLKRCGLIIKNIMIDPMLE